MGHDRHHDIQLEISIRARPGDCGVIAENFGANHHHRFAHHRIDFAGHDGRAGLRRGNGNLTDAAARAGGEPADVVGDFGERHRNSFELT